MLTTKRWVCLLGLLLALCLGLSAWLLVPRADAAAVEVWSRGELMHTLPLDTDTSVTVEAGGTNVVTVKEGKVAVTEADCPDGYCMARGFCSGGAQIVCLPNRLVLRFVGEKTVDGVAG